MESFVSQVNLAVDIDKDHPEQRGRGPFRGQRAMGVFALKRQTLHLGNAPPHPLNRALTKVAGSVVVKCGCVHHAKLNGYIAIMKTMIHHIAFGVLFTLTLAAQAQLTQPDLPDHGFSFVYGVTSLQPEGFDWSLASSIQNVNFDFVPADSTAYADQFSQADFSQQTPGQTGGINEAFYEYNPDYFGFWGGVDGASGIQIVLPEVVEYLPYPMEVGDAHQDTLVFDFTVSGLAYVRDYSVDMEATDVGTLMLPGGQMLENTMRIEAKVAVIDSSVTESATLLTEGSQYWSPDMPLPVAQTYTYTQIVDGDSSVIFSGAEFLIDATAGFDLPLAISLEAFPSPAKQSLNVVAKAGSWVRVLNLQGQTVERRQLTSDREIWDVSTWPAGFHFLQVEGSRTTRRVLITH